jgi:Protein of unknown function (DUF3159)
VTPSEPPSPLDFLRDPRAAVDTGLGPLAFVIANAVAGLRTAAAVAVGVSVVLMIERLLRRRPVVNAVGGLLGTVLCAFIALRTGKPTGYFVPRMLYQLALAVVFAGSALVRRPLVGFIVATLYRADPGWSAHPAVRRTMTELTLAWALLFGVRGVVYAVLILTDKVGWLAAASIVMGWPAFALLIFGSYRYGPRRIDQLGGPPPRRGATP